MTLSRLAWLAGVALRRGVFGGVGGQLRGRGWWWRRDGGILSAAARARGGMDNHSMRLATGISVHRVVCV